MKTILRLSLLVFTLANLIGCGGDEPQPGEARDLSGGPVKKEGQLRGGWIRTTEGAFAGLEFTENGQVLASLAAGGSQYGTVTLNYSVLEGGRLSLTGAGNRTVIFSTTLDGDRMEIRPEGGGMALGFQPVTQQFRKLEKGQTLAAALQEEEQKRMASIQARIASLQEFLSAEDLVMVRSEDNGPETVFALRLAPSQSQIAGEVVMDETPGRDEVLAPVRLHPVRAQVSQLDNISDRLRLVINIAGAVQPLPNPDATGRAEFVFDGPIKDVKSLEGKIVFPKAWMGEADYRLHRNGKQHKDTVAHLEAQAEAKKKVLMALAEKIGGRITLSGAKTLMNQGGQEQALTLILERQEGEALVYGGVAKVGNGPEQPASGNIEMLLGQAVFFVSLQLGEQWRLQPSEDGKSFTGLWRPNPRSDFISHGEVTLNVEKVISMEKLLAERQAIREFLTNGLRTPKQFAGFARDQNGIDTYSLLPVFVELVKHDNGTANAKMWMLYDGTGVSLNGTTSGGSFVFTFKDQQLLEGSAPIGTGVFGRHTLNLDLSGIDPEPTFTGRYATGKMGADKLILRPVNGPMSKSKRAEVIRSINNTQFLLRRTDTSRPRDEQTWVVLQVKDDGSVTGEIYGEGEGLFRPECPPGILAGKLIEDRGHLLMQLTMDSSPHPTYGGGRESKRTNLMIAIDASGDAPVLQGWTLPERGNQDWFVFLPAQSELRPNAENVVRLAAQRMGAVIKPPSDAKPGDEVIILVHATERDARVGQVRCDGSRYCHGDSIPAVALHAGILSPGEMGIVKLVYSQPFQQPVEEVERNGVASRKATFRQNNAVPSFTIQRVAHQ